VLPRKARERKKEANIGGRLNMMKRKVGNFI
jgi:hypothetical protein